MGQPKIAYINEFKFPGVRRIDYDETANKRTDTVWLGMFDADIYAFNENLSKEVLKDYDLILFNHPKLRPLLSLRKIREINNMGLKTAMLQHGGYFQFMKWNASLQKEFIDCVNSSTFFIATNKDDYNYFKALFKTKVIYFPTAQDMNATDKYKSNEKRKGVFVGGNMTPWYEGTTSLLIADKLGEPITLPTMGNRQPDEMKIKEILQNDLRMIPYLRWDKFVEELSKHKYAVHMMPVAACGSFHLLCATLGIPCIGRAHVTTQKDCFPSISISDSFEDINKIVKLVQTDYDKISKYAVEISRRKYNMDVIKKDIFKKLGI